MKVWGLRESVELGNWKILDKTMKEKIRALQKDARSLGLKTQSAESGLHDTESGSTCSHGPDKAMCPSCGSPPSLMGVLSQHYLHGLLWTFCWQHLLTITTASRLVFTS